MFIDVLRNGIITFVLLVIAALLIWAFYDFITDILGLFRREEDREMVIGMLKIIGWIVVLILMLGMITTLIVGEQK